MRDRSKTIDSLRRLAERPGSVEEGNTARRLLELMGGTDWIPTLFDPHKFPLGSVVYYCYWCYRNDRAVVVKGRNGLFQYHQGQTWMRLKFDRLKTPRWVPVTSNLGCHIGIAPFVGNEAEVLYRRDIDWQIHDAEFREKLRNLGIGVERLSA